MRASTLAWLVFLCAGLAACSPERRDWRSAEAADTIEAYTRFIEHHPQGELAAQARARIVQLAEKREWERASEAHTERAYRQFLNQYPEGQWSHEARIRIESFALASQSAPGEREPTAANREGFAIQLGAFSSEAAARAQWHRVAARFAAQLNALTVRTVAGESGGARLYRLQAIVADEQQARDLCARLKAHGQACVVVLPAR